MLREIHKSDTIRSIKILKNCEKYIGFNISNICTGNPIILIVEIFFNNRHVIQVTSIVHYYTCNLYFSFVSFYISLQLNEQLMNYTELKKIHIILFILLLPFVMTFRSSERFWKFVQFLQFPTRFSRQSPGIPDVVFAGSTRNSDTSIS